jgi:hypothetical protein
VLDSNWALMKPVIENGVEYYDTDEDYKCSSLFKISSGLKSGLICSIIFASPKKTKN